MSTNLARYSEDFTNAVWEQKDAVVSNDALSPGGTLTADRLDESTGSDNYTQQTITIDILPGDSHTFSIWLKTTGTNAGNSQLKLILIRSGGTHESFISNPTITSSWARYSITANWLFAHPRAQIIVKHETGGPAEIHIWGAQLEPGSTATRYQLTMDTSVINNTNHLQTMTHRRRR